jgi:ankyrin repeat protein
MTPLHYAAWQGSIDCVQLLLEHKADINKADAVSDRRSLIQQSHL